MESYNAIVKLQDANFKKLVNFSNLYLGLKQFRSCPILNSCFFLCILTICKSTYLFLTTSVKSYKEEKCIVCFQHSQGQKEKLCRN